MSSARTAGKTCCGTAISAWTNWRKKGASECEADFNRDEIVALSASNSVVKSNEEASSDSNFLMESNTSCIVYPQIPQLRSTSISHDNGISADEQEQFQRLFFFPNQQRDEQ